MIFTKAGRGGRRTLHGCERRGLQCAVNRGVDESRLKLFDGDIKGIGSNAAPTAPRTKFMRAYVAVSSVLLYLSGRTHRTAE